jgi:hypothetical protein
MESLSLERGKQSSLFFERVPKVALCADDFGEGLRLRRRSFAQKRKHIQFNPAQMIGYLCFDVDKERAHESWHDANLPCPSLIVQNPENGHAHLLYALAAPVCRTDAARLKPLKFAAVVEEGLRLKLGADEGFAGLICKTPHHQAWRTFEPLFEAVYELGELAEWVDLPTKVPKRLGIRTGIGRNVELFDRLRFWSYKWLADYKAQKDLEGWGRAVLGQCQKFNDFGQPLPDSEVRSVAKSVAKWTWTHYTGRMSDDDFSKLQAVRGKRKGKKVKTLFLKDEVKNG